MQIGANIGKIIDTNNDGNVTEREAKTDSRREELSYYSSGLSVDSAEIKSLQESPKIQTARKDLQKQLDILEDAENRRPDQLMKSAARGGLIAGSGLVVAGTALAVLTGPVGLIVAGVGVAASAYGVGKGAKAMLSTKSGSFDVDHANANVDMASDRLEFAVAGALRANRQKCIATDRMAGL